MMKEEQLEYKNGTIKGIRGLERREGKLEDLHRIFKLQDNTSSCIYFAYICVARMIAI